MLFSWACYEVVDAVHGCFDSEACNYNPDATIDDNSCEYESCADCVGILNGDALEDQCGICQGDDTYCLPIDLSFGNIYVNEQEQIEVELLIDTPQNIFGFQFDIVGASISGANGGLAQEAGFTVSAQDETVLGFSFAGGFIPVGSSGVLTNLSGSFNDASCLEIGNGYIVSVIEGIPTFEDLNSNQQWDDGEDCFYNTTDNDCEGTQLILENWNELIDEYGLEKTLEELYDRSDGFNEDVISYSVNFGDCISIPVLN